MSRRLAAALLACGVTVTAACGADRGDGLHRGKVEVGLTTTTTDRPCDVPAAAERAITEASLNARRMDATARSALDEQFDRLDAAVPPSLRDDASELRAAFTAVWADAPPSSDPFEGDAYLAADQAIRRYVASGCTVPSS